MSHALNRGRTTIAAVRALLLVLGLLLAWTAGSLLDLPVLMLAGSYIVATVALWSTSAWQPRWLPFLTAVLDVAAAALFILAAQSQPSAWLLYAFPMLVAGSSGPAPVALAGVLSAAAYLGFSTPSNPPTPGNLWPAAALAALAAAVALLPSRWLNANKERHAWDQWLSMRETARREGLLSAMARSQATFDVQAILHGALDAVRECLGCSAEMIPSDAAGAVAQNWCRFGLSTDWRLVVHAATADLGYDERRWLERLVELTSAALRRTDEHARLSAEEARLRHAWLSSPTPAALHTTDGQLILANASYGELRLEQAVPAPSPEGTGELEVVAGKPERVFALAQAPVEQEQGVLTIYREITQERQAVRARDELLSLVGHELRGPLTSIHGFSQMMSRNLAVVQQQVGQLDRLIGDLMSKSALESGQLSLDLQAMELSKLVADAAERFRVAHPDRELRLSVEPVGEVQADPARLMQVLDNLMSNAVKYSQPESPLDVGLDRADGSARLWVRDYGAGIGAEHLPHLFDRFYRIQDADAQSVKGLGLGLAIVRELVVAHGGQVWAESDGPGKGSTFYVTLPLAG